MDLNDEPIIAKQAPGADHERMVQDEGVARRLAHLAIADHEVVILHRARTKDRSPNSRLVAPLDRAHVREGWFCKYFAV